MIHYIFSREPLRITVANSLQIATSRRVIVWSTSGSLGQLLKLHRLLARFQAGSAGSSSCQLLLFDSFSTPFSTFWAPEPRGLGTHIRTLFPTLALKGPEDPCSGQKYSQKYALKTITSHYVLESLKQALFRNAFNKLKTTPAPNKNGSYGIKGGVRMP